MNNPHPKNANADALVEKLLQQDLSDNVKGNVLNDLLECFFSGYPVSNLLRIASNKNLESVQAVAWLTSELGERACELRDELKALIEHEDPKVRFCMADYILLCCGRDDGETIQKLVSWIDDKDAGLRWKAMDTLVRLGDDQIEAAKEWLMSVGTEDTYQEGLLLILNNDLPSNKFELIQKAVTSGSKVLKRLSFIAAIRNHLGQQKLQELVSLSQDNDIVDFFSDYYPAT